MAALGGLLPPVVATLVADVGEFTAKMGEAKAEMTDVEGTAARTGAFGKAGLLALAAGAVAVGAESINMASKFDASMTRINTQDNADLTTKQMGDLRNAVLNLAGPTAQAPDALAEAMIHVYGSGMKGAQALDVLRIAAEGATVGHANLTDVTNALDAAIAINIPGVQNYRQAMGELNATVGAGDMTMQNLADALGGPMLATVKGYGLNITDVGAALAVFGDRNIRGSEAATELRMAVQALAVPAAKGGDALAKIGLATNTLQKDMQAGGLKQALNDLNDHLLKAGYNSTTAGTLITEAFGKKAGGGLNVLMDSLASSTSNFNEKFKEVARSGQNFGKDWAETQDTLAFKIKSLESAAEALGIKIGNFLIPVVTQLLGWMSDLGSDIGRVVDWFKRHHDAAVALGAALGGVLLYGVYAASAALWEMAAAVVAATWPFLAIAAAIGALTYGVIYAYEHWSWFRTIVKDVGAAFVDLWHGVQDFVKNFGSIWSSATKPFVDAWNDAYKIFTGIWKDQIKFLSDTWDSLKDLWDDTGGKAVTAISNAWDSVSTAVSGEWDHIYADLSSIWSNLVELWNDTGGKLVSLIGGNFHYISNGIIKPTWDLIKGLTSEFFSGWLSFQKAFLDTVVGVFKTGWDVVYNTVKTAWDLISSGVAAGIDFITGLAKAGWDVILGGVHIAWDMIKLAINTPLDAIKNSFQMFTDLVTGKWSKLWNDTKALVVGVWNDIYGFFKSILGTITQTVSDAASNIWSGFTSAISDATAGVWNALIDIWNTIFSFFKDAGTWLLQTGKDIIQGLINGVKSMGSHVWDAAKDIAGQITGGLGSLLHFGSPSRTMHQYGIWIGQGLAGGMNSQQSNATSAANALARAALAGFGNPTMTATGTVNWASGQGLEAAGMNGGTYPAAALAGGYGGYGAYGNGGTQAPNIQIYLDGKDVSGAMRSTTLRYDMRNSGNNLALAGRGFA